MIYYLGTLVLATFISTSAALPPCVCTLELEPVCGSDGNTYANGCAMDCEAREKSLELVKVHDGECRQKRDVALPDRSCVCTAELEPVCGSDGKTYPNSCAMDCEAREGSSELVKVHDGECE